MNFKLSLGKKSPGLNRRSVLIGFIIVAYEAIRKKSPTKPFHVIGKVYSHKLEIGEFVVATTLFA